MTVKSALIQFLSGFPELSKAEAEAIAEHIPIESFKKGTILVKHRTIVDFR